MQIALHSDTGRRLLCVSGVDCFNAWKSLIERIASEYGIPEVEMDEAIRIEEDADGIERLTVDGKPVGYVATEISGVPFGHPTNDNVDEFAVIQSAVADLMAAE
jgi:hypothetical protein